VISINTDDDSPSARGPRPGRRPGGARPGRGARLLFIPLFLVGAAALFVTFINPLGKSLALEGWHAAPCVITASRLDGDRPAIEYLYEVGPKSYRSSRIALYPQAFSSRSAAAAVVARYPRGKAAECFVNPADPTDAVLSRDLIRDLVVLLPAGLLSLLVMTASFLAYFGLLRRLAAWLQLPGWSGD
jgi:hypothetical protein